MSDDDIFHDDESPDMDLGKFLEEYFSVEGISIEFLSEEDTIRLLNKLNYPYMLGTNFSVN
jgi:hypothetical protein